MLKKYLLALSIAALVVPQATMCGLGLGNRYVAGALTTCALYAMPTSHRVLPALGVLGAIAWDIKNICQGNFIPKGAIGVFAAGLVAQNKYVKTYCSKALQTLRNALSKPSFGINLFDI